MTLDERWCVWEWGGGISFWGRKTMIVLWKSRFWCIWTYYMPYNYYQPAPQKNSILQWFQRLTPKTTSTSTHQPQCPSPYTHCLHTETHNSSSSLSRSPTGSHAPLLCFWLFDGAVLKTTRTQGHFCTLWLITQSALKITVADHSTSSQNNTGWSLNHLSK